MNCQLFGTAQTEGKVIIMGPERRVVKEWLKTIDREELDAMLQAAIFTPTS